MLAPFQAALNWLGGKGQNVGSRLAGWLAVPTRKVRTQTFGLGEYCSRIRGYHNRVGKKTLIMVSQARKH